MKDYLKVVLLTMMITMVILIKFDTHAQKQAVHTQFSALNTRSQMYTPEQGSILLTRGESSHGINKLTNGYYSVLILKFWPDPDAPIGSYYTSVEDTKPVQKKGDL